MSLSLFRFIAALRRTQTIASTFGAFVLGGFVVFRDDIYSWWHWGYWASPLMYAQNANAVIEILANRWHGNGEKLMRLRGIFAEGKWYWIGVGALLAYNIFFNILYTLALQYLNPFGNHQAAIAEVNELADEMRVPSRAKFRI